MCWECVGKRTGQVVALEGSRVVTLKPHWSKLQAHLRVVPYCVLNQCSMDRLLVRQTGMGPMAAESVACWGGKASRYHIPIHFSQAPLRARVCGVCNVHAVYVGKCTDVHTALCMLACTHAHTGLCCCTRLNACV